MNLESWGRFPRIKNTVLGFTNDESLRELVSIHHDLIPYGNGRSYGDSALSTHVVNVRPHDCFMDFDEESGLLEVQAGVLLSDILDVFVPRGWFLKISPGTKLITIGGAIASDVHGKNHHVAGCFSECVKDFRIMLANGEVIICSKTETPEYFKATCGGQGLTGVILSARIYLQKINSQYIDQTTIKTTNLKETLQAFEECKDSPYSVAWVDCLAKGDESGRGLLMAGDFLDDGDLAYQAKKRLGIPFSFPGFALNNWNVKAFNRLYHGKTRIRVAKQKTDIDTFFYPLDAFAHWNRIYGRQGFVQYQFVLPLESSHQGLEEVLKVIADSGKGSFLAVLKLHGKANENWLSFPMEGFSLALDFRVDHGLFPLLEKLDEIVIKYRGRIYLAKDARVSKEVFESGYPQIDIFRKFRMKNGMDRVFQSSQSKRVGI